MTRYRTLTVELPDGSTVEYTPMPKEMCPVLLRAIAESENFTTSELLASIVVLFDAECHRKLRSGSRTLDWSSFIDEMSKQTSLIRESAEALTDKDPIVIREAAFASMVFDITKADREVLTDVQTAH